MLLKTQAKKAKIFTLTLLEIIKHYSICKLAVKILHIALGKSSRSLFLKNKNSINNNVNKATTTSNQETIPCYNVFCTHIIQYIVTKVTQ